MADASTLGSTSSELLKVVKRAQRESEGRFHFRARAPLQKIQQRSDLLPLRVKEHEIGISPSRNGWVSWDQVNGTILHQHWRVEVRRRYFTRLSQFQRSPDGFLRFFNHVRPHHGYRTRGRTPAALLLEAKEH